MFVHSKVISLSSMFLCSCSLFIFSARVCPLSERIQYSTRPLQGMHMEFRNVTTYTSSLAQKKSAQGQSNRSVSVDVQRVFPLQLFPSFEWSQYSSLICCQSPLFSLENLSKSATYEALTLCQYFSTVLLFNIAIYLFISVGCQGNISKVFHQILEFYFSSISINKNYFNGCRCSLQKQCVYQMCFILCCISYISSKLYQCWYQKNGVVFIIFCKVNIM